MPRTYNLLVFNVETLHATSGSTFPGLFSPWPTLGAFATLCENDVNGFDLFGLRSSFAFDYYFGFRFGDNSMFRRCMQRLYGFFTLGFSGVGCGELENRIGCNQCYRQIDD